MLATPPAYRPWHGLVAGGLVAGAGLAAEGFPKGDVSLRSAVYIALVTAAVVVTWSKPVRLAWVTGFFLPLQQFRDVPLNVPEFTSIAMVGLVAFVFSAELEGSSRRLVVQFLAGLTAMVAVQTVFGLIRDPLLSTLRFNGLYAITIAAAGIFVFRVAAYRPLLVGHLAGSVATSLVAVSQAAGWDPIGVVARGDDRFQGLALEPPGVGWHTAVAIPVAIYLLTTAGSASTRRAAWAAVAICSLGMIVCGAQGGLVGLGVSLAVCAFIAWRRSDTSVVVRTAARPVGIALAMLVAVIAVASVAGFGISSLRGVAGDPDKGYENERARVRAIEYGIEQLSERPLTGIGNLAYEERFDVRPHVLPLNLSVNTGVVGLLIGTGLMAMVWWAAVRGPTDRWPPEKWLATVLLITMFTHACLTPSGPFARIERVTVLVLAMAVATGGAPGLGSRRSDDKQELVTVE